MENALVIMRPSLCNSTVCEASFFSLPLFKAIDISYVQMHAFWQRHSLVNSID
jgi:hypothetical protein